MNQPNYFSPAKHVAGEAYNRFSEALYLLFFSGMALYLGLIAIEPTLRGITALVGAGRSRDAIAALYRQAYGTDMGQVSLMIASVGIVTCGIMALAQTILVVSRRREMDSFFPVWVALGVYVSLAGMGGLFYAVVRSLARA